MKIERVRHQWTEKADFVLYRPDGAKEYILLHFHTPVELRYDERTYSVVPGSLIVFEPGLPHTFTCHGPLLHDWIHISGDVKEVISHYGLHPNILYSGMEMAEISETIAFLEVEYFAQRSYWMELSNAKLHELFIRIAHNVAGENPNLHIQTETFERLRDARAHMLKHPEWEWSIEALSNEVGLSPSRLHTLYKTTFGVSPKHDLILMRIEKSKNLLEQGKSITETAESMGYSSTYHYIRQFRQIVGVPPGRYRRGKNYV